MSERGKRSPPRESPIASVDEPPQKKPRLDCRILWTRKNAELVCPNFRMASLEFEFRDNHLFVETLTKVDSERPSMWASPSVAAWCGCRTTSDFGCEVCLGNYMLRVGLIGQKIPKVLRTSRHAPCINKAITGDLEREFEGLMDLVINDLKPLASVVIPSREAEEFIAKVHRNSLEAVLKRHDSKSPQSGVSWELYIVKASLLDKPLLSLFNVDSHEILRALFDLAEASAIMKHGDDGRGRIWSETMPLQSPSILGQTLGAKVIEFASSVSIRKTLDIYDLAEYTSGNLYDLWTNRQTEKYKDFLHRMDREGKIADGFAFCASWIAGALFGYPFWTSFSLCLNSEPYDVDSEDDNS